MTRTREKATLQQGLRSYFKAQTRCRGLEYFLDGLVEDPSVEARQAVAVVLGTDLYDVALRWYVGPRSSLVEAHCSCPAFADYGPCKHLWALALVLDDTYRGPAGGLVTPVELIERDWREEPQGRGPAARRGSEREHPSVHVLAARKPVPEWTQGLKALEACLPRRRDPWGLVSTKEYELRYVVESWKKAVRDELRITVRYRSKLKNGSWGASKEYAQGARNVPALVDPTDRAIHAILCGAASNDYTYPGSLRGQRGYRVGNELCARLLPELARSGRLYIGAPGEEGSGPFLHDEGEAWAFRPVLERDEDAGELRLAGTFERAGEVLSLADAELVLEAGFLMHAGLVARWGPGEAFATLDTLLQHGPLRAPLDAEEQILEVALRLPGFEPPGLQETPEAVETEPRPHLFAEPPGRFSHHSAHLACTISLDYGGERVSVFEPRELLVRQCDGRVLRRDFEAETRALKTFLGHGGKRVASPEGGADLAVVPMGTLPRLSMALLEAGWAVEAEGKPWRRAAGTSLSVKSGIDWFDLEGGIDFGDGQVANLPELLAAAQAGTRTVRLGDGSTGVLPERWLESWGLLKLAGKPEGDALRFGRHQGWLLDALLAERENVRVDEGFSSLRKRLASFRGVEPKREPRSFRGELRDYQRGGLGWFALLRSLGLGGCLADDMGLGKTVQVLALLESRRLTRRRKGGVDLPSLVVAPRSLVFNWIDEARRFTPNLSVLDYTGLDRRERLAVALKSRVDLVITTYGTLRRDILELREQAFDYVVLDEAQAIKNSASQSAKAARLLDGRQRLALSGTPIENHLGELWSLFEFLNPGMLGASRAFQSFSRGSGVSATEEAEFGRLSRALAPFFLRRTKEEVLPDLPEKTEQVLHCELKGSERREYDRLRDFYRSSLAEREQEVGLPRMKVQVLTALLRLRQTACHPGLVDKDRRHEDSAKLNALLPMLEELCGEGHKALVFSQFTSLLGILRRKLDDRGLTYEYLDGRTRKRKEKVERFQSDPACPLFLISIKAGGHGLNLTAADYVFLLDPWWNPAVEAQAIDRVHRIGLTKPVIAYRLIATNTVEEKVVELQEKKRRLADAILGQGRVGLRDLTREDLELLLS